jgi:hypothetical protein
MPACVSHFAVRCRSRRFASILILLAAVVSLSGCVVISSDGATSRSVYIVGFAKVRVENTSTKTTTASLVQLTGVGIALSDALQLGYFDQFKLALRPDSNTAVVVVRNKAERDQLEAVLKNLNQQGICLVTRD